MGRIMRDAARYGWLRKRITQVQVETCVSKDTPRTCHIKRVLHIPSLWACDPESFDAAVDVAIGVEVGE